MRYAPNSYLQRQLGVHTALQGLSPPPSSGRMCAPRRPTNADHTVKNRASLLVPVSPGTRCSHKHTGWQGLLGKRAGPQPGLLGTDTKKNE